MTDSSKDPGGGAPLDAVAPHPLALVGFSFFLLVGVTALLDPAERPVLGVAWLAPLLSGAIALVGLLGVLSRMRASSRASRQAAAWFAAAWITPALIGRIASLAGADPGWPSVVALLLFVAGLVLCAIKAREAMRTH